MTMTNDLTKLNPYVKYLCQKFLDECKRQGFIVIITSTLRTMEEQKSLYEQGRSKPGSIVTYSKPGYSNHNYGLAFDIVLMKDGKEDWNNDAAYRKMGAIGQSMGLVWGGSFRSIYDSPHYEWTGGLTITDLLMGKRPVAPKGTPPVATLQDAISYLQVKKCIATPVYWVSNAKAGKMVEAAFLKIVMGNYCAMYKIVNNINEIVDVLHDLGVINQPKDWIGWLQDPTVNGELAAALIMNMYNKIMKGGK